MRDFGSDPIVSWAPFSGLWTVNSGYASAVGFELATILATMEYFHEEIPVEIVFQE